MPEYKNKHIYQEVAITEQKYKVLSRKDLFFLLGLSDQRLNAFISETIMTTSKIHTQSTQKLLLFLYTCSTPPHNKNKGKLYLLTLVEEKFAKMNTLPSPNCASAVFIYSFCPLYPKNKQHTGYFVKLLAKNSSIPIRAK